ncbi:hypothetical protein HBI56_136880 [Parastagonospora nodorum]|nr:hypothetical protein HBH53_208790 [Parastagonospora nodorum]KAH3958066.1 hypothetical protein HBH51_216470 [Parastagonospora nodorum]KAH3959683.1 hypothetical protein HBH52_242590 [Parastagonospora nodorum]KAH3990938.1 hypothetical protein HBI10_241030 [Parastagonospora nodorum]KAH4032233.1 hypothetical protein HBI13_021890 [Parastagonospora nodorum]
MIAARRRMAFVSEVSIVIINSTICSAASAVAWRKNVIRCSRIVDSTLRAEARIRTSSSIPVSSHPFTILINASRSAWSSEFSPSGSSKFGIGPPHAASASVCVSFSACAICVRVCSVCVRLPRRLDRDKHASHICFIHL